MDHCQVVMGVRRGQEMRALLEDVTGKPCPCAIGQRCPLRPAGSSPAQRIASEVVDRTVVP